MDKFPKWYITPSKLPKLGKPLVPLLVVGGGIFAAVVIGKIAALKSLTFKGRNVRVNVSEPDPLVFLDIGIINPTGQNVKVKSISGIVSVDQTNIARVFQDDPVLILPHDETPYTIPFKVAVFSAASEIVRLITSGGSRETLVRFVGTVNLEGILFPVNVSYKLI